MQQHSFLILKSRTLLGNRITRHIHSKVKDKAFDIIRFEEIIRKGKTVTEEVKQSYKFYKIIHGKTQEIQWKKIALILENSVSGYKSNITNIP